MHNQFKSIMVFCLNLLSTLCRHLFRLCRSSTQISGSSQPTPPHSKSKANKKGKPDALDLSPLWALLCVIATVAVIGYVFRDKSPFYKKHHKKHLNYPSAEIPSDSFLLQLDKLAFGQSEEVVEKILGKTKNQYTLTPECLKDKEKFIYKRWTDKETKSSAQLLFDADKKLSLIALHNGNIWLNLKDLLPQYNIDYIVGFPQTDPYTFRSKVKSGQWKWSNVVPMFSAGRIVTTSEIQQKSEQPLLLIRSIRRFEDDNKFSSMSVSLTKRIDLFDCRDYMTKQPQYKDGDYVLPVISAMLTHPVAKFEVHIRPKPIHFDPDSVMLKLNKIRLGQRQSDVITQLGKPDKQMPIEFGFALHNQRTPYTYTRWTDNDTGSSVQLLFDRDKKLTMMVFYDGHVDLDLQSLLPQYRLPPYLLGKSDKNEYFHYNQLDEKIVSRLFRDFSYDNQEGRESYRHLIIQGIKLEGGMRHTMSHLDDGGVPRSFALSKNSQIFVETDEEIPLLAAALLSLPPQLFETWGDQDCKLKELNWLHWKHSVLCRKYPLPSNDIFDFSRITRF